jgi:hypothetical protein
MFFSWMVYDSTAWISPLFVVGVLGGRLEIGQSCDSSSVPSVAREDPFVFAQMLPYVLVSRMYTYV